jgi:hypothetical protein
MGIPLFLFNSVPVDANVPVTYHTVKKVCGSWNQKLYIGEYSGIYSLKLKNSGIYNLGFAPS